MSQISGFRFGKFPGHLSCLCINSCSRAKPRVPRGHGNIHGVTGGPKQVVQEMWGHSWSQWQETEVTPTGDPQSCWELQLPLKPAGSGTWVPALSQGSHRGSPGHPSCPPAKPTHGRGSEKNSINKISSSSMLEKGTLTLLQEEGDSRITSSGDTGQELSTSCH